jgi:Zn-dependent protease with chaperone function
MFDTEYRFWSSTIACMLYDNAWLIAIVGIICSAMIWLWTRFCMLFLCWSSRANEYVADKYAMELGYGYELAYALDTIGMGTPKNSFMKALYSTHPKTHDRIGRLQSMGVPYSKY